MSKPADCYWKYRLFTAKPLSNVRFQFFIHNENIVARYVLRRQYVHPIIRVDTFRRDLRVYLS